LKITTPSSDPEQHIQYLFTHNYLQRRKGQKHRVGRLIGEKNELFQCIGLHLSIMLFMLSKKMPLSLTATYRRRLNARYVFQIYYANCWTHYLVMAALMAARLVWDIAWAFSFKTLPIRTPTGFKYGEYGGLTAGGQLSPQC
jgi:hypothetical protein